MDSYQYSILNTYFSNYRNLKIACDMMDVPTKYGCLAHPTVDGLRPIALRSKKNRQMDDRIVQMT